jgi:hypothetical protein
MLIQINIFQKCALLITSSQDHNILCVVFINSLFKEWWEPVPVKLLCNYRERLKSKSINIIIFMSISTNKYSTFLYNDLLLIVCPEVVQFTIDNLVFIRFMNDCAFQFLAQQYLVIFDSQIINGCDHPTYEWTSIMHTDIHF